MNQISQAAQVPKQANTLTTLGAVNKMFDSICAIEHSLDDIRSGVFGEGEGGQPTANPTCIQDLLGEANQRLARIADITSRIRAGLGCVPPSPSE